MTKEVKLYNVLFPFWMLLLFPQAWLIVLPGNFLIDSLVLVVSLIMLQETQKKNFYKAYIVKIYLFGLLSDFFGAAYMILMLTVAEVGRMGDEIYLTLPALLISAVLIFVFNYFFTFKKTDKKIRLVLSLVFAIITAPYTFLIPSSWLYF